MKDEPHTIPEVWRKPMKFYSWVIMEIPSIHHERVPIFTAFTTKQGCIEELRETSRGEDPLVFNIDMAIDSINRLKPGESYRIALNQPKYYGEIRQLTIACVETK